MSSAVTSGGTVASMVVGRQVSVPLLQPSRALTFATMSRPELQAPPEIVSDVWVYVILNSSPFSIMVIQRRRNTPPSATARSIHLPKFVYLSSLSTRIQQIQADMTHRAIELLALPEGEPKFLLDIGCGSGLSGEILDEEGHQWVGVDIAPSMLGKLSGPCYIIQQIKLICSF